MEWQSTGAELPRQWKEAISDHHHSLLGRRGLGRYAWCVAAEMLLCLPPDLLRELASRLRGEAERDWDSFASKWNDRDQGARDVASELLVAIRQAMERIPKGPAKKK